MQVQVETYVDERGAEKLRRFRLDSRVVEVADNIDQWHGADYRYVKVRGSDGNVYILRHNEVRVEWELMDEASGKRLALRALARGLEKHSVIGDMKPLTKINSRRRRTSALGS
jgi:hypothetical protein